MAPSPHLARSRSARVTSQNNGPAVDPPRAPQRAEPVPPGSDAWPSGSTGHAFLRFRGAGAYAHLDLAGERIAVPAGARGTWTVAYRPDVWPIQPGGSIDIRKWEQKFVFGMTLQTTDPNRPDYCSTHVERGAEPRAEPGVDPGAQACLEVTNLTPWYKRYHQARLVVRDAAVHPGETACFVAGDTSAGAPPAAVRAFTGLNVAIDVQVDHDGDGWPEALHRLWIDVVPDRAMRLRAVAPSTAVAGTPLEIAVHAEDVNCNPGATFEGEAIALLDGKELARGRLESRRGAEYAPLRLMGLALPSSGIHRIEVLAVPKDGGAPLRTWTNPIQVLDAADPSALRVFWGELHSHTAWCDGTGTVDEGYRFARDQACLDWFSLSEHIMLGPGSDFPITNEDVPIAVHDAYWRQCQAAARRHHAPGTFVTFIGYEWTAKFGSDATPEQRGMGGRWGHHCAWFFDDEHPLVIERTLEEELDAFAQLVGAALARNERPPGMVMPHQGGKPERWTHYAGRDLVAVPAVEISSMHAHSEYLYQEALAMGRREGARLGVVAMDDGHMGHPGYDIWARHGPNVMNERPYSVQGGLTAALAPELTRDGIWDAIYDRRTYATTGERMLLDVWVENARSVGPAEPRVAITHHERADAPREGRPGRLSMGQVGTAVEAPVLRVRASGTAPLDLVEIIRDDRRVFRYVVPPDTWDVDLTWTDERPLREEATYYIRVTQTGDAFAWSSPIWLTFTGTRQQPVPATSEPLPLWLEGEWPPEGDEAALHEARAYQPELEAFLEVQGAAGLFADLRPVGVFAEHRGRYALFRGRSAKSGGLMQARYYPDFAEPRVRFGAGWSDFGADRKAGL